MFASLVIKETRRAWRILFTPAMALLAFMFTVFSGMEFLNRKAVSPDGLALGINTPAQEWAFGSATEPLGFFTPESYPVLFGIVRIHCRIIGAILAI